MSSPAIPETLTEALTGRYSVERELGRGGMATVYLAQDLRHKRRVALKVLDPELGAVVGAERFRREIEMAAELQHPHVLPVFDSGEAGGGWLWYTMPYVEGESLRDRLQRQGRLPIPEALRLAREVAEALDYAHGRGVIHRDVKPGNILLSQGHALVADFGIARQGARLAAGVAEGAADGFLFELSADSGAATTLTGAATPESLTGVTLTSTGMSLGTPAYMSPEQALGIRDLDGRSDQYAVGCVLYEMLAGAPPYTGESARALIGQHVTASVPNIRAVRPEVPSTVSVVIARAMAKTPEARFASAAEFATALDHATPASLQSALAPYLSRRRLFGTLALLVTAALGLGALFLRSESAPSLDEHLVAVAPFEVLSPGLATWREGLVDVLSRNLDGLGSLHTVPPTTVLSGWRGRADLAGALALGRRTKARLVVYGGVSQSASDSVRLAATVLDVARERPLRELDVRGAATHMDRLVDSLAIGLLRELGRAPAVDVAQPANLGAHSLPALKAYLQADQHYRRTAWDSTQAYAEQAVKLDPSFALGYRRLAQAFWEQGNGWTASRYAVRAGELNHALGPRDSLLVLSDSIFLWLAKGGFSPFGSLASSPLGQRLFPILEEMMFRYPEDPEVWYALGQARYHLGVWLVRGGGWRATREAFEGSVHFDSLFVPAYYRLVELNYTLGDTARARRFAAAAIRLSAPNPQSQGLQALQRLLTTPDSAAQARALDSLPKEVLERVYGTIAFWLDSTDLAVRVARRRMRATPDTADVVWARILLAHALAFRGHLREALALPETVPSLFAEAALLSYVPEEQAKATFSRWLRLDGVGLETPALALPWWGARRDIVALRRYQYVLDSVVRVDQPQPSNAIRLTQMATATRAQLALARGDTAAALRVFDSLFAAPTPCAWWCQGSQLLYARLLAARGRHDKAARVLNEPPMLEGNVLDASPTPLPSDILWYLERGKVAERLGDSPRAREVYDYVANAWRRPDPELARYADEARTGLARLTTQPKQ